LQTQNILNGSQFNTMHQGQYAIKKSSWALRHVRNWHTSLQKELSGLQPWYHNLSWIYGCSEVTGSKVHALWRIVQLLQTEAQHILDTGDHVWTGLSCNTITTQTNMMGWFLSMAVWRSCSMPQYCASTDDVMWLNSDALKGHGEFSSQKDPLAGVSMWWLPLLPW